MWIIQIAYKFFHSFSRVYKALSSPFLILLFLLNWKKLLKWDVTVIYGFCLKKQLESDVEGVEIRAFKGFPLSRREKYFHDNFIIFSTTNSRILITNSYFWQRLRSRWWKCARDFPVYVFTAHNWEHI